MKSCLQCAIYLFLFFSLGYCEAMTEKKSSGCGDWEPYEYEKCFKLPDVGTQNAENAEEACEKQGDTTLLTIHSEDEQRFLSNFLFNESGIVDKIWIGLKRNKRDEMNIFKWNDGTDTTSYSNWATGYPTPNVDSDCVQMASGLEFDLSIHSDEYASVPVGKWVNVPCKKDNKVVCQKMQKWSMSRLQKIVLKHESKLKQLTNVVPIGFIYVQLPSQPEPKSLWPTVKWEDVSSEYAGLFFRVLGGGSSNFGATQGASFPTIRVDIESDHGFDDLHEILTPNHCTPWAFTGKKQSDTRNMKFCTSSDEVRPINKAIRIWKRTN